MSTHVDQRQVMIGYDLQVLDGLGTATQHQGQSVINTTVLIQSSSSSLSLYSRSVPWLGEGLSMPPPNYPVLPCILCQIASLWYLSIQIQCNKPLHLRNTQNMEHRNNEIRKYGVHLKIQVLIINMPTIIHPLCIIKLCEELKQEHPNLD